MADRALEILSMKNPVEIGLDASLLNVGDRILEVAGDVVVDQLDFHYHASLRDSISLKVERTDGTIEDVVLETKHVDDLGIVFKAMDFRRCRCKCPFCFVDQMPKGLRKSLYIKDEDFRLSFLYGNFTTMNDITDAELEKIIRQRNSPQWVSVHCIDEKMRAYVFGRPMKRRILDTLRTLADAGIAVHTQAVLIPDKNDGAYLRETIETLEDLHENIRTLAVVPVGLTRFREGLPKLRTFRPPEMEEVLDLVEPYRGRYLAGRRGSRFVFPSDEWYLGSGREVPGHDAFEGYPQIDNGVGMVRQLLTEIDEDIDVLGRPERMDRIRLITGELGEKVFSNYVYPLLRSRGVEKTPEMVVVPNHFFGTTVTCSGLLVAQDMIGAIKKRLGSGVGGQKTNVIPENCLNHEGLTIDGLNVDDMSEAVSGRVTAARGSFIGSMREFADGEVPGR